eukprot:scaffold498_cov96-Isochrysis_galbana.AAC.1
MGGVEQRAPRKNRLGPPRPKTHLLLDGSIFERTSPASTSEEYKMCARAVLVCYGGVAVSLSHLRHRRLLRQRRLHLVALGPQPQGARHSAYFGGELGA